MFFFSSYFGMKIILAPWYSLDVFSFLSIQNKYLWAWHCFCLKWIVKLINETMKQSFVVKKIFVYWFNEIVFCLFQCSWLCFSRNFKSSQSLQFSCIIFVKFFYDLFKVCIIWSSVHSSNWLCYLSLSQSQYHQMTLLLLSKIQMFP